MKAVALALGQASRKGDVFALEGPLGAGKTLFAQSVARGAGVPANVRVTSPTFAIMQVYQGKFPVIHADLYRLASDEGLQEIGLFSLGAEGLVLVEWPERAGTEIPANTLWIELSRKEKSRFQRRVTLRTEAKESAPLIEAAEHALAAKQAQIDARRERHQRRVAALR